MGQQIVNCHHSPCIGNVGKVGLDWLIDVELSSFLQEQNAGGGELFGQRSDAEFRVGSILNRPVQIGIPIGSFQNNVIPLCDKYVAHEASVIHIILDHFDHSLFVEWRVLCGQDRRDADNHSEEDEACAQGQSKSPQFDMPWIRRIRHCSSIRL